MLAAIRTAALIPSFPESQTPVRSYPSLHSCMKLWIQFQGSLVLLRPTDAPREELPLVTCTKPSPARGPSKQTQQPRFPEQHVDAEWREAVPARSLHGLMASLFLPLCCSPSLQQPHRELLCTHIGCRPWWRDWNDCTECAGFLGNREAPLPRFIVPRPPEWGSQAFCTVPRKLDNVQVSKWWHIFCEDKIKPGNTRHLQWRHQGPWLSVDQTPGSAICLHLSASLSLDPFTCKCDSQPSSEGQLRCCVSAPCDAEHRVGVCAGHCPCCDAVISIAFPDDTGLVGGRQVRL